MRKSVRQALLVTATVVMLPVAAQAAPFHMDYTGTVTSVGASLSGLVSAGDGITIRVTVDNGGNSAASQTWTIADTVSAVVTAGSYVGTWIADFYTPAAGFATDAAGILTSASWFGTFNSPSSVDNLGTGARLYNGNVQASNGDYFGYTPSLGTVAPWSNPVAQAAPIPLPAAGWMLLAGLGGLAALRRRKAA